MTMTTSRMKKEPETATIRRQLSQAVIGLSGITSKVPAKIIPDLPVGG
jgi:hypothetical protein